MDPLPHLSVIPLKSGPTEASRALEKQKELDLILNKDKSPLALFLCKLISRRPPSGFKYPKMDKTPRQHRDVPKMYRWDEWKIFHILKDYVQPSSTMSMYVVLVKILDLTAGTNEVVDFTSAAMELATQIPYHHSGHWKLARLFRAFSDDKEVLRRWGKQKGGVWENLTDFWTGVATDSCDTYRLNVESTDWDHTPARDINFQAFLAHLMEAGVCMSSSDDAFRAMRDAFTHNLATSTEVTQGVRDGYVLVAAQWILWSGQMFFKSLMLDPRTSWDVEDECFVVVIPGHEDDKGTDGKPRFLSPLVRWHYWRDCFQEASRGEERSEECRTVAAKVVSLMNAIEGSMVFPMGWQTGEIIILNPDGTRVEFEQPEEGGSEIKDGGKVEKLDLVDDTKATNGNKDRKSGEAEAEPKVD